MVHKNINPALTSSAQRDTIRYSFEAEAARKDIAHSKQRFNCHAGHDFIKHGRLCRFKPAIIVSSRCCGSRDQYENSHQTCDCTREFPLHIYLLVKVWNLDSPDRTHGQMRRQFLLVSRSNFARHHLS